MYMIFLGMLLAAALGFGIWSMPNGIDRPAMADAAAYAAARSIRLQHLAAVHWIEEETADGRRIRADHLGTIDPPLPDDGIEYNESAFGEFPTVRVGASELDDWAIVTYLTPDRQEALRTETSARIEPDAVLRALIELSGGSRYTIGVYENGRVHPLDRSARLAAPADTPWSPMDPRDPAKIPDADKPANRVNWVVAPNPTLPNAPTGLDDGSWVLVTVTPGV
jgi:hypothetical protein